MKAKSDQRSAQAEQWRAWYGLARWKRIRAKQLQEHPLCAYCLVAGIIEPAFACDHIEPHNGKRPRRRYSEEDIREFLERRRRREASCPSIVTRDRHSINLTSSTPVIGFMDRRNARIGNLPKNSRPQS
ncbi:hypothetical protein [Bradyrhizobium sp. Ai1a-2]|uniref:hypothetical protein n=1 Tax=Bradyrhizobium sp. Ai1a-2 TaxID=196490 RepID=UPI0004146F24|nr:hypothetical protein [Bradyrhizobium sp. Ai1a-2]